MLGATRGLDRFRSGPSRAIPDFLTPRPTRFAPSFEDEVAIVRATPPEIVRRDLIATHAPDPARAGRQVLYRRTGLGDQLAG
ncbi:MAG: hypothetical protein ACTHMY_13450 [Solirubrobacteraceae bacterium]